MQQRARVTAADIARLAGVGRAAVSNWRKRYDTFPAPVGGTAASPQFDLEQVEQWLAEQGKLPAVEDDDRLWRNLLAAAGDPADALAAAGEHLAGRRSLPFEQLRPELDKLVEKHGERDALEILWSRFANLPGQRSVTTPDALADLMVTLSRLDRGTVFDPTCGTGRLLRGAVRAGATEVYGQDNDPASSRLAELWHTVNGLAGQIRTGDSLRHDAFPDLAVDAVVANLPFGLTNWGHEELGYDRRWEYGVPPRTEPELAWVQHALAHLKPGGHAVLLMPPSAASRRAGRRIRSELLRRGALRAIIALPPGAAAPHAISLHLWILQRTSQAAPTVLLVDAAAEPLDTAFPRVEAAVEQAITDGIAYAASVIDLLDDEVDLTPGRHSPTQVSGIDQIAAVRDSRERLAGIVNSLPDLLPEVLPTEGSDGPLPVVGVADLIRTGRVQLLGPVRVGTNDAGPAVPLPVLTSDDVIEGRAPSGRPELRPSPQIPLEPGDVIVPTIGADLMARVVTTGGALLGRNLFLLRCNPGEIDPWFLAGYLRTSGNERQTVSSSGSQRYDVRKAQVPRIPLGDQRRHGAVFQKLQQFEEAIRASTVLSGELSRRTADGLAGGSLSPGGN